jgi:glycosyltransferase involved in cell wall biosynthesis/SAM-dependent methyltransferase
MSPAAASSCPVCDSSAVAFLTRLQTSQGDFRSFYRCAGCGSVFDPSNAPADYENWTAGAPDGELAIKFAFEARAGLFFMAPLVALLGDLLSGARPVRFAEVGAGVGFLVHLASWMGWDASGIEPSPAADAGREALDVRVARARLEAGGLPRDCDAVLASEVIEHVPNPDDFVARLALHLAPEGVLLLTTPSAAVLADGTEIEVLDSFWPGEHLIIFSPIGMRLLLDRHGFHDVRILEAEGSSGRKRLVVLAAREQGRLAAATDWQVAQARGHELLRGYLGELVASRQRSNRRDSVYAGALGRLAELLVNTGRFDEAEPHLAAFEDLLAVLGVDEAQVKSLRSDAFVPFLRRAPACIGSYYFASGILALRHRRDLRAAQRLFALAGHVFALEETVLPALFPGGRHARARLHEGIALLEAGRCAEAARVFETTLTARGLWPDVRRDLLRHRAMACIQLGQNGAALAALGELVADDPTLVPAERREVARHILLAAGQLVGALEARADAAVGALAAIRATAERTSMIVERMGAALETLACRIQELRGQQATVHAELTTATAALGRDVARIAAALELLAWTARLPIRAIRAVSRAFRRPFRRRAPVFVALPSPDAGRPHAGPLDLRQLPGSVVRPDGKEVAVGELVMGRTLAQAIVCPEDGLAAVWVKLGTYGRESPAHLQLDVVSAEGRPLRRVLEPVAACVDNDMHRFAFDPIPTSGGEAYTIVLSSPDASPGNGVAVWCRPDGDASGLRIDDRPARGRIICDFAFRPPAPERDLLIVTPDTVAEPRIGLGMRHWEIARALAAHGLQVTLASVHPVPPDVRGDGFEVVALGAQPEALVRRHAAVLVQGDVLHRRPELARSGAHVIADMVTPIHIENLEIGGPEYAVGTEIIRKCLRRGDFFICGNESQRLYWLGMLTAHGRLTKECADADKELRGLIDVVGFGIPDEAPVKTRPVLKGVVEGIEPKDFVLLWFGGLWDWLDPLTLVRAAHAAHAEEPRVKLYFAFHRRPGAEPTRMARATWDLAAELGALGRSVFFGDLPVPHGERADYLCESDVGVLCQAHNFETRLSARTRILDYVWAGRPILVNAGDESADLVERHNLGLVVPGRDAAAFRDAILALVRTPGLWSEKAANVERIRPRFYWTRVVEPVVRDVRLTLRGTAGRGATAMHPRPLSPVDAVPPS